MKLNNINEIRETYIGKDMDGYPMFKLRIVQSDDSFHITRIDEHDDFVRLSGHTDLNGLLTAIDGNTPPNLTWNQTSEEIAQAELDEAIHEAIATDSADPISHLDNFDFYHGHELFSTYIASCEKWNLFKYVLEHPQSCVDNRTLEYVLYAKSLSQAEKLAITKQLINQDIKISPRTLHYAIMQNYYEIASLIVDQDSLITMEEVHGRSLRRVIKNALADGKISESFRRLL